MTWNHRVVKRAFKEGGYQLGIHEAYYDGNGKVFMISSEPDAPVSINAFDPDGGTIEELRTILGWMLAALDQPILDYDDIPEAGANDPLAAALEERRGRDVKEES